VKYGIGVFGVLRDKFDKLYYKRRIRELEHQVQALRNYIDTKLDHIEKHFNERIAQLEFRLSQLEEFKKANEHLCKVLDSCDPETRIN